MFPVVCCKAVSSLCFREDFRTGKLPRKVLSWVGSKPHPVSFHQSGIVRHGSLPSPISRISLMSLTLMKDSPWLTNFMLWLKFPRTSKMIWTDYSCCTFQFWSKTPPRGYGGGPAKGILLQNSSIDSAGISKYSHTVLEARVLRIPPTTGSLGPWETVCLTTRPGPLIHTAVCQQLAFAWSGDTEGSSTAPGLSVWTAGARGERHPPSPSWERDSALWLN